MSDRKDKKLTVPKFSSFKPKGPASAPVSASVPRSADIAGPEAGPDEKQAEKGHKEDRRSRQVSSRHSDIRHRDRQRSPDPKSKATPEASARNGKPQPVADRLYVIDKKGDPLIIRYGGNDSSSIPHYRRSGRGRILGASGFITIHRDRAQEEFTLRRPGDGSSGARDRELFKAKLGRLKPRPLKTRKPGEGDDETFAGTEDFVPLRSSTRREREDRDTASPEDDGPSYRSIEGKAKAHEFSDSDLAYSSDSDSSQGEGPREVDPLRQTSIDLRIEEPPRGRPRVLPRSSSRCWSLP
jgi:hypothetical protein